MIRALFLCVALLLTTSSARAQEWTQYVSRQDLFAINFPGTPTVTETTYRTEYELDLPARVHAVTQGKNRYSVTVVDYSKARELHNERVKTCTAYEDLCNSRGGLELRGVLEYGASRIMTRKGSQVTFYAYGESDRVEARYVHLDNPDKTVTFAVVFFHETRLYILEGTVTADAPVPTLFEQGMQFLDKDGERVRYERIYRNGSPAPPRVPRSLSGC